MTDQEAARVVETLRVVLGHLREPAVDVVWSHYSTVDEAIQDIEAHVTRLASGDTTRVGDLRILFAPTGSFQEIAISNGWGDEFIRLSEVFDAAIGETS